MSGAVVARAILPRPMLVGLALLIVATVLGVAAQRWSVAALAAAAGEHTLTDSVALIFSDLPTGAVVVELPTTATELTQFAPGTNHFARGLLRSIGRERRKIGLDMAAPLQLGKNNEGFLTLSDPLTSNTIVMAAFGSTNAAVFQDLYQTAVAAQPRRVL
ncbi:MAG: photosynthetic complex assembly protein PuhC [Pseudomonadales bacterium]